MKKPRHRQVKQFAQDNTAKKWQNQDWTPDDQAPEAMSWTLPEAASEVDFPEDILRGLRVNPQDS